MRSAADYPYSGEYDKTKFTSAYELSFAHVTKFNKPSIPDLLFLLGKIGSDKTITDTRWAAYMLATMFVETSHTVRLKQGSSASHRTQKVWRNFTPVEEAGHGRGREYFLPVKVDRLSNGDALVTEWDGDQWRVLPSGIAQNQTPGILRGIDDPTASASPIYVQAPGQANQYYGRGYVQLTWWDNYLKAGIVAGKGLAFLFDPDQLLDRDQAYSVMSVGMVTGKGFANGRRLSQYFIGAKTDYVHARDMINKGVALAQKKEVADIARKFEDVLFLARIKPSTPGT
jgi:predicted chitinase